MFFSERDEFIRFFLGKGLQQQQAFTPYAALDGSNNIEKEFGVNIPYLNKKRSSN